MPALFNDFQQVVGQRFPDVPATVAALHEAGARFAAMTGSGAAMIALFDKPEVAEAAAETFGGFEWVADPDSGPDTASAVGAGAGWIRVADRDDAGRSGRARLRSGTGRGTGRGVELTAS